MGKIRINTIFWPRTWKDSSEIYSKEMECGLDSGKGAMAEFGEYYDEPSCSN
jgi:hypothetical protein